jgi:catechol 2,3-dioxygenase-like lactoylglutathione lyase family enzyme
LDLQPDQPPIIEGISAITLATRHIARAIGFYQRLGFKLLSGGEEASFSSFAAGSGYLNLTAQPQGVQWSWWGRIIFYVSDVDAF